MSSCSATGLLKLQLERPVCRLYWHGKKVPYKYVDGRRGHESFARRRVSNFNTSEVRDDTSYIMAAFFKSFRKGFVVCRGLDANLSGKVPKKTTLTRKSGRHAHNVFLPLAIAAYEICHGLTVSPSTALTLLPLRIEDLQRRWVPG